MLRLWLDVRAWDVYVCDVGETVVVCELDVWAAMTPPPGRGMEVGDTCWMAP